MERLKINLSPFHEAISSDDRAEKSGCFSFLGKAKKKSFCQKKKPIIQVYNHTPGGILHPPRGKPRDVREDEVEQDVFVIKMLLERLKSLLHQSDNYISDLHLENEALREEIKTLRLELSEKERRVQLLETII